MYVASRRSLLAKQTASLVEELKCVFEPVPELATAADRARFFSDKKSAAAIG
jgi:hypothetical protein